MRQEDIDEIKKHFDEIGYNVEHLPLLNIFRISPKEKIEIGLHELIIEEKDDYTMVRFGYSLNKEAMKKYRTITEDLNSKRFKTFWNNMKSHFKTELLND